jgi:hypothetical protein
MSSVQSFLALPRIDTFAYSVGASFLLLAVFGQEQETGDVDERLEPEKRFAAREQYGNNLGRKPSQMIPNNPKWVLL